MYNQPFETGGRTVLKVSEILLGASGADLRQ